VKDWTLEGAILNPNRPIRSVAFSPDGRWLATGSTDRSLLITDLKTWDNVVEKRDQSYGLEGLAFSSDSSRLYSVTGSWDPKDQPVTSSLSLWRVHPRQDSGLELELKKTIPAHAGTSDQLVLTPDSKFVITGSADAHIKVWDAQTLELVRSIKTPCGIHRLHLLRNNPDQLLLGDHLGGVSVWNLNTGVCLSTYAGHVGHVFDVSATKDGRLLVSAGEDDSILLWPGPDLSPNGSLLKFIRRATKSDDR
jgi:WD40 repeat protein